MYVQCLCVLVHMCVSVYVYEGTFVHCVGVYVCECEYTYARVPQVPVCLCQRFNHSATTAGVCVASCCQGDK